MKKNGKKFLLLLLASIIFFGVTSFVRAQTCSSEQECTNLIGQYQDKINQLQGQAKTLKNQIAQFDAQIYLTSLKIADTENKIAQLGGRIDQLEVSLNNLTVAFSSRAVETYKTSRFENSFMFMLTATDINDAVARFHYLKKVQQEDTDLMQRLQEAQTTYKGQKTDQETLQKQLQQQQANLNAQKIAKNNLLASTQSDESKYQSLLSQAIAQRNAFLSFVTSQGGASILSNQTVCNDWGCYYNQRDSQWGNNSLGISGLSVANYGCLVSSSAMIASFYKKNINPGDIAANAGAFFSDTAYLLYNINVNGVSINRTPYQSISTIDSELAAGRPVIVGLYSGPAHFVVLKSGSNGNYVMNDPFVEGGHDIPFTSKYNMSAITDVEKVSVQ